MENNWQSARERKKERERGEREGGGRERGREGERGERESGT